MGVPDANETSVDGGAIALAASSRWQEASCETAETVMTAMNKRRIVWRPERSRTSRKSID
jgi:hypothetical protein